MDVVARNPGVANRADFARNRLTVIVPTSNPARIRKLADLAKPGVKLVLAAPGVPAGDYARTVLRNAGIAGPALRNVVSNEVDVEGVVAKVASGDADAGIVYVTDVPSNATAIPIPPSDNVVATYLIGVVHGASEPALATSFIQFVLGPGRSVLRRDGFLPP
jgi:molybdate transport system substrate-binding protein